MSRSTHPLIPAKPVEISLDTLPQLFAHHRARFGGWSMTSAPPEPTPPAPAPTPPAPAPAPAPAPPAGPTKPDGVTDEEWTALGDPGRTALVRERDARTRAERDLAASRARPTPPPTPTPAPAPAPTPPALDPNDVQGMINAAVAAAVKPFTDAEDQRRTQEAADAVRTAVVDAAKTRLHDATDALTGIDLAAVLDDQGRADPTKVKTALDELVTKKPHLAKPEGRLAPPGIGGGAPAGATEKEKVAAVLADMQKATGVRPAGITP